MRFRAGSWLGAALAASAANAQDCPHGTPARQIPITFHASYRQPFRAVATAARAGLEGLWFRIDSSDVATAESAGVSFRRGYWRTRVYTRWPESFDRRSMQDEDHPGLVATLTARERGDSVAIVLTVVARCATVTGAGDTLRGPVEQLRTRTGIEVIGRIGTELRRR
jgi:hypothetical protein